VSGEWGKQRDDTKHRQGGATGSSGAVPSGEGHSASRRVGARGGGGDGPGGNLGRRSTEVVIHIGWGGVWGNGVRGGDSRGGVEEEVEWAAGGLMRKDKRHGGGDEASTRMHV